MRVSARAVRTLTTSRRSARSSTGRRWRRCRRGWLPRIRRSSATGCGWPGRRSVYRGDRTAGAAGASGTGVRRGDRAEHLVTQRVKANLFYRGLTFHRFPLIGDSIYTRTEVVGLRANSVKPGRAPTGLAALRMITIDQADRLVLDFYRCAMLPVSPDFEPADGPSRRPVHHRRRGGAPTVNPAAQLGRRGFPTAGARTALRCRHRPAVLHSAADVVTTRPNWPG